MNICTQLLLWMSNGPSHINQGRWGNGREQQQAVVDVPNKERPSFLEMPHLKTEGCHSSLKIWRPLQNSIHVAKPSRFIASNAPEWRTNLILVWSKTWNKVTQKLSVSFEHDLSWNQSKADHQLPSSVQQTSPRINLSFTVDRCSMQCR